MEYKCAFWAKARTAMIDQVTDLRKQVNDLKKCRPQRESVELTESEDEATDPEFDKMAPTEMPAGRTSDLQEEEIVKYEDGQLFSLCDDWRKEWTSKPSFGLGKIAERLDSLTRKKLEMERAARA